MAISRARGQARGDQMGDQVDALFLGLGDGVLHGLLVQQAVLHQPLGEPAQRRRLVPPATAIALSFIDLH